MAYVDYMTLYDVKYKAINPSKYEIKIHSTLGNVNWSDIQDKLIRLAAKYTNEGAHQIIQDINNINEFIENPTEIVKTWYFGFKEYGVDYENPIFHNYLTNRTLFYKAIFRLEVFTSSINHSVDINFARIKFLPLDE